jgi:hypothetical protein
MSCGINGRYLSLLSICFIGSQLPRGISHGFAQRLYLDLKKKNNTLWKGNQVITISGQTKRWPSFFKFDHHFDLVQRY